MAIINYGVVRKQIPDIQRAGKVISLGGLKLRVIEMKFEAGLYYDAYYVSLARNPHGELRVLYLSVVKRLLAVVVNLEARVRGFMLKPVAEGSVWPFTQWLYERLM